MKIDQLTLTASKTVNIGNFNNIKISAGVTVTIEEGDDMIAVREAVNNELRDAMVATWRAQRRSEDA